MGNQIIDCLTRIKTKDGRYRMLMDSDFKYFGKDVTIYPNAKILKPEVIEIGDHTAIDDFVFIYPGEGLKIGKHVHIAACDSIIGSGTCELGDYSAFATGSRIITATNSPKGGYHMSASAPRDQQNVVKGKTVFERDSFMGANSVVMPNLHIGEGAVIGAGAVMTKNAEPWTIYVGIPAKKIGKREKVKFNDNNR